MVVGTLSKVKAVDSVAAVIEWTQYTVDTVCSGCSTQWNSGIWLWDIVFDAKRSNQSMHWMQYTVDAVCSGCSGIVVYGGGDIVFDTKSSIPVDSVRSTQLMQWNSGIWWWGHCL